MKKTTFLGTPGTQTSKLGLKGQPKKKCLLHKTELQNAMRAYSALFLRGRGFFIPYISLVGL